MEVTTAPKVLKVQNEILTLKAVTCPGYDFLLTVDRGRFAAAALLPLARCMHQEGDRSASRVWVKPTCGKTCGVTADDTTPTGYVALLHHHGNT